jgi:DNA-directed RNA polymerase specialized sigma subunit
MAKKNYLNNKDLMIQIKLSKEQDKMTNEFIVMLKLLCHRYSKHSWFANYSWVEDMEAYAMLSLCRAWKSFDETRYNNPFAYYTQTIKNAYFQYLNAEKKHQDIRDALLIERGADPSFNAQLDDDDSHLLSDYRTYSFDENTTDNTSV